HPRLTPPPPPPPAAPPVETIQAIPGPRGRAPRYRRGVAGIAPASAPRTAMSSPQHVLARLLVPSSALLWGLHFALLSPALAIILATLYDASTADIGWNLAVYNAGGFLASVLIPAWADR